MTPASAAPPEFVDRPSQNPRTASTLRLRLLMEKTQRLEIGSRIRELRERAPFGQEAVADKLGIGLRAYQKVEGVGTTKFERCEEIFDIHKEWARRDPEWAHLSAAWIWDGQERDTDLLGALNEAEAASTPGLRELSATVVELRKEMRSTQTKLLAEIGKVRRAQEALQRRSARPGRKPGDKEK